MALRPPRSRQDRFEAMTASIMERIAFRSGRNGRPPKIAPSGKVYVSTRFDGSGKSQKSIKSSRSHRGSWTGGRRQYDIPDDGDDAAHGHSREFEIGGMATDQAPKSPESKSKPSIRRVSLRRIRRLGIDREQSSKGAGDKAGSEDILSNFVYGIGEDGDNKGDEGESDSDNDAVEYSFERAAMSDGEDEVAYFANRSGLSEFKARRRYTLHPHGRFRAGWDVFQLLLMTWILITVPFELCFSEISVDTRRDILKSDLFVDAMFAIDIVLNFNTAVECDGKLHFSPPSIIRHYTRTYFLQDLVWTFPFYMLFESKDVSMSAFSHPLQLAVARPWLYPFSRCLRLLRVIGIPRIQRRLEYSLLISSKVSSLGSFLFLVLALSHVFSCVFSYLAFSDEAQLAIALDARVLQNTRLRTKYIASFYWSIMTMTTVGYGDIAVKTNSGRLFSLCAMAVGAGVFAYGITNVVSLFQQLYIRETEDRQKMDQVNVFMQHRGFPRKLRDEVRANIFNWRKVHRENKELDREIFAQMARPIRAKVADLFCEQTMPHRMPFLAGCDAEFVHDLYLAMQIKLYLPGEDIIRQGEYGSEMYFLFVGHAQALLRQTPVAMFGPDAYFGEFSIVNPLKARLATIQALDFCETHCVDRQTILSTFVRHPNVMRSVHQLVELRSRKALTLVYESGGKSRTLLQGLAVMWRTEGIPGVLPVGASIDSLPVLQEFLPASSVAGTLAALSAGRRLSVFGPINVASTARRSLVASYRLTVDQPAATAAPMIKQQKNARSLHTTARERTDRRPISISSSDHARINASLASVQAAIADAARVGPLQPNPGEPSMLANAEGHDKVVRRIKSFDPAALPPVMRLVKRRTNPSDSLLSSSESPQSTLLPATTSAETSPREFGAILTQLQELGHRQCALDERMTEILSLLSPDVRARDRFNEQHRIASTVSPLVRDRSQYFNLRSIDKVGAEDWNE